MHHMSFDIQSTSSIMQNEIEAEEYRLRKLLQESIMKVEKENFDLVLQEMRSEDMIPEKDSANVIKDRKTALKLSTNKKFKNYSVSSTRKPLIPNVKIVEKVSSQTNCCGKKSSQHSTIHFLNHFQTALSSSKAQLQHQNWETRKKQIPCAIPLSPPCQKHVPFAVEKILKPIKEAKKPSNTALYKVVSNEGNKQLTVQTLPSISIFKERFKGGTNVYVEEIREIDKANMDLIKPLSQTKTTAVASAKFFPRNQCEANIVNQNIDQAPDILKRSVSTETTNKFCATDSLKLVVKDVVADIHRVSCCQNCSKFNKGNIPLVEEVYKASTFKDQISQCTFPTQSKDISVQTEQERFCSYSHTEDYTENKKLNDRHLKDTIREVLFEFPVFSSLITEEKSQCQEIKITEESEKYDKEIQTNILSTEKISKKSLISKEIQTSFQEQNFSITTPQSRISNETLVKMEQGNVIEIPNIEVERPLKNATFDGEEIAQQLSAMTLKIENLMNAFNDHVCKSSSEITRNTDRHIINDYAQLTSTREVSLQFSPYMISRSAHTSSTRTFEMASQCDILTVQTKEKPTVINVSTQSSMVEESFSNILNGKEKIEAFTQCECPVIATIDSCVQTEFISTLQVSEHSSSTSVSSTPVNDNLFLDDILSEGEIPWHLRFLTCDDKSVNFNSSNTTESSGTSEEKDYSLSEGEIHPKYIQQWYEASEKKDDKNVCSKLSTSGYSVDVCSEPSTSGYHRTTKKNFTFDLPKREELVPGQGLLPNSQGLSNNIQQFYKNSRSDLPHRLHQHGCDKDSPHQFSKNKLPLTCGLFSNNQKYSDEGMNIENSKCTFAPFEQKRKHLKCHQNHYSKSELHLKTLSPNNYSSLSSLDYSSGEVLEESTNCLQSTPR